jgi:hypothetical protein
VFIGSTALSAPFVKDKVVTSKLLKKKPSINVKYFAGNLHSNNPAMNLSFFALSVALPLPHSANKTRV